MDKKVEIRVVLDEDFKNKIEKLKFHYGVKNNTELIRILITDKYREIIKEN